MRVRAALQIVGGVERHNGTDRNRNAQTVRKTYGCSKDWDVQEAVSQFTLYTYIFCLPVRTLWKKGEDTKWRRRTPATSASLTDQSWSMAEWLTFPDVQHKQDATAQRESLHITVPTDLAIHFCYFLTISTNSLAKPHRSMTYRVPRKKSQEFGTAKVTVKRG